MKKENSPAADVLLLRDDIRAFRACSNLTSRFSAAAAPIIGVAPLRNALSKCSAEHEILDGCELSDEGILKTDNAVRTLGRMDEKESIPKIYSAFSALNSRFIYLYSAVTSPELAKETIEEIYKPMQGKYKSLPTFPEILRGMPTGILEKEKLDIARRKELEQIAEELKDSRDVLLSVLEDTDDARKRLERAYEDLKALDKMKDEFLSMTSHELKTPLTSMISFTQLMRDEKLGKLTAEQVEALGIISDDIRRLRNSVEKVVEISRIDSGRMKLNLKNLRAENLIQRAVENMRLSAKQKQIVITQKIDKLPLVRADGKYLDMVITNLLDNAIKFTPERGEVIIEAERGDGHVLVRVKDTGAGIAPEDVRQLFTKFFQADHSTPGSGLGLYICKTIVEAHGGKIWAESQPRNGSTFYFTLPLVKHAHSEK